MKEEGVTLVELMIVMSVIAILVVALGFSYQGWQGKYRVESAAKTLYSDLMDARARATGTRATYLVDFPTVNTYRVALDANGNGAIDAGEVRPTFPKTVNYVINGGVPLMFDSKGLIYSGAPLRLIEVPVTISLTSTVNPDYDCINIYPTKIALGQMNPAGTVCNEK